MPETLMTLQQWAAWARGALRDEYGPPAAEVVVQIDSDLMLYGAVREETRMLFEQLDERDRQIVVEAVG